MRVHVFVFGMGAALGMGALLAPPAAAQTYGQPHYGAEARYGIGEAQTRAYVATGAHADGYGYAPRPYVPAPWQASGYYQRSYGYGHGYDRGGRYGYSAGHRGYGYDGRGHASAPRYGYRDDWGYQDDRPPSRFRSARSWSRSAHAYDRDCRCGDVYLYDR